MIDLEHNTELMHYNPQAPIDTVLNQVEDILEYGDLDGSPYKNSIRPTQPTLILTGRENYMIHLKPGTR